MEFKCPARESSEFLCDRVAKYQINGTVWCNTHARRILEGDDLTVRVREYPETSSDLEKFRTFERQREVTEQREKSGWEKQVSDIDGVQNA